AADPPDRRQVLSAPHAQQQSADTSTKHGNRRHATDFVRKRTGPSLDGRIIRHKLRDALTSQSADPSSGVVVGAPFWWLQCEAVRTANSLTKPTIRTGGSSPGCVQIMLR